MKREYITWLWYCPKTNKLFTKQRDKYGWSAWYPNGISNRKLKYPKEAGCVRIGRF